MAELPILYTFLRCPYAMRARMALIYAGIDFNTREVDLSNKPAQLLKVSPKGTVPVLILNDGTVLEHSMDIIRWALQQNDPEGWTKYPDDIKEQIDRLVLINDSIFKDNLNHYKYPNRYPDDPNGAEFYRHECEKFINYLEDLLMGHDYFFGYTPSIADIALFPFVRQFSMVDPEWFLTAPYQRIQDWLFKLSNSKMFEQAMQKVILWQE